MEINFRSCWYESIASWHFLYELLIIMLSAGATGYSTIHIVSRLFIGQRSYIFTKSLPYIRFIVSYKNNSCIMVAVGVQSIEKKTVRNENK